MEGVSRVVSIRDDLYGPGGGGDDEEDHMSLSTALMEPTRGAHLDMGYYDKQEYASLEPLHSMPGYGHDYNRGIYDDSGYDEFKPAVEQGDYAPPPPPPPSQPVQQQPQQQQQPHVIVQERRYDAPQQQPHSSHHHQQGQAGSQQPHVQQVVVQTGQQSGQPQPQQRQVYPVKTADAGSSHYAAPIRFTSASRVRSDRRSSNRAAKKEPLDPKGVEEEVARNVSQILSATKQHRLAMEAQAAAAGRGGVGGGGASISTQPRQLPSFACPDCGKSVSSMRNLQRHKQSCPAAQRRLTGAAAAGTPVGGGAEVYAPQTQPPPPPPQPVVVYASAEQQQQGQGGQCEWRAPPAPRVLPSAAPPAPAPVPLHACATDQPPSGGLDGGEMDMDPNSLSSRLLDDSLSLDRREDVDDEREGEEEEGRRSTSISSNNSGTAFRCECCKKSVSSQRSLKRHQTTCKQYIAVYGPPEESEYRRYHGYKKKARRRLRYMSTDESGSDSERRGPRLRRRSHTVMEFEDVERPRTRAVMRREEEMKEEDEEGKEEKGGEESPPGLVKINVRRLSCDLAELIAHSPGQKPEITTSGIVEQEGGEGEEEEQTDLESFLDEMVDAVVREEEKPRKRKRCGSGSSSRSGVSLGGGNNTCEDCQRQLCSASNLKRHRSTCKALQQQQQGPLAPKPSPVWSGSMPEVCARERNILDRSYAAALEGAKPGLIGAGGGQGVQQQPVQTKSEPVHHSAPSTPYQQAPSTPTAYSEQPNSNKPWITVGEHLRARHVQQQQKMQQGGGGGKQESEGSRTSSICYSVDDHLGYGLGSTTDESGDEERPEREVTIDYEAIERTEKIWRQQGTMQMLSQHQQQPPSSSHPQEHTSPRQPQQPVQQRQFTPLESIITTQPLSSERLSYSYQHQQQSLHPPASHPPQAMRPPPPPPHEVDLRFQCPECLKTYSCRKNVKRHRMAVHKLTAEEVARMPATHGSVTSPGAMNCGQQQHHHQSGQQTVYQLHSPLPPSAMQQQQREAKRDEYKQETGGYEYATYTKSLPFDEPGWERRVSRDSHPPSAEETAETARIAAELKRSAEGEMAELELTRQQQQQYREQPVREQPRERERAVETAVHQPPPAPPAPQQREQRSGVAELAEADTTTHDHPGGESAPQTPQQQHPPRYTVTSSALPTQPQTAPPTQATPPQSALMQHLNAPMDKRSRSGERESGGEGGGGGELNLNVRETRSHTYQLPPGGGSRRRGGGGGGVSGQMRQRSDSGVGGERGGGGKSTKHMCKACGRHLSSDYSLRRHRRTCVERGDGSESEEEPEEDESDEEMDLMHHHEDVQRERVDRSRERRDRMPVHHHLHQQQDVHGGGGEMPHYQLSDSLDGLSSGLHDSSGLLGDGSHSEGGWTGEERAREPDSTTQQSSNSPASVDRKRQADGSLSDEPSSKQGKHLCQACGKFYSSEWNLERHKRESCPQKTRRDGHSMSMESVSEEAVIHVGAAKFKVHKACLCRASPFLSSLLSQHEEPRLDARPQQFQRVLDALHNGHAINGETIDDVVELSQRLQMRELHEQCERFIEDKLPSSSIMHAIRLAEQLKMAGLKQRLFDSISIDVFRSLSADQHYRMMGAQLKAELLEKWGTFL